MTKNANFKTSSVYDARVLYFFLNMAGYKNIQEVSDATHKELNLAHAIENW